MNNKFHFLISVIFLIGSITLSAQNIKTPRLSPAASVSHEIGLSCIQINYSSPGVNNRTIYGVLVPYDVIWRAGANENTTISFSDNSKINGYDIPAGTYGFHIIPTQYEWTLIFNKEFKNWGSFFYDDSKDQLRINVKPVNAEHQERLVYGFENYTPNSIDVYMHWEKKKVSFTVEFDVHNIAIDSFKEQLKGISGFGWQGPMQAANYCLQNNIELELGLKWIDQSINSQKNIHNLMMKASILQQLGRSNDIESLTDDIAKFIGEANEFQANNYANILMNLGELNKAIDVFKSNLDKYPESWNAIQSLAEAYVKLNDNSKAIELYKKALEIAPSNQKARIEKEINRLEK